MSSSRLNISPRDSALRSAGKEFCSSRSTAWAISKKLCATDTKDCSTRNNVYRSHKKLTNVHTNVWCEAFAPARGRVLFFRIDGKVLQSAATFSSIDWNAYLIGSNVLT